MSKKITTEEFIDRSRSIHGDKYDYSLVLFNVLRDKVRIVCEEHGEFLQRADSHFKSGCKKCSDDSKRGNLEDFIYRSRLVHSEYSYEKSVYRSYNDDVIITCPIHGDFKQTPHNHLKGQKCYKCNGGGKHNLNDFKQLAEILHNHKYSYEKSIYISSNIKLVITCPDHGDFEQTPNSHLMYKGCSKCSKNISKGEICWLDLLSISECDRHKTIQIDSKIYRVDALVNSTIYEFYGDYWHGNPNRYNLKDINRSVKKTFGELYDRTIKREEYLKSNGYNIVSIWESDYKKLIKENDRRKV